MWQSMAALQGRCQFTHQLCFFGIPEFWFELIQTFPTMRLESMLSFGRSGVLRVLGSKPKAEKSGFLTLPQIDMEPSEGGPGTPLYILLKGPPVSCQCYLEGTLGLHKSIEGLRFLRSPGSEAEPNRA